MMRFFEAWLLCPMAKKTRPLMTFPSRCPMHHWHTVGLDIPYPVARLQSRTPLLQAIVNGAEVRRRTHPRNPVNAIRVTKPPAIRDQAAVAVRQQPGPLAQAVL